MRTHKHTIWTSDYERFEIVFEDHKPVGVTRCEVVWSDGRTKTASTMMSIRVQKIIKAAEREIWGER